MVIFLGLVDCPLVEHGFWGWKPGASASQLSCPGSVVFLGPLLLLHQNEHRCLCPSSSTRAGVTALR
jgi:hypothetical protein